MWIFIDENEEVTCHRENVGHFSLHWLQLVLAYRHVYRYLLIKKNWFKKVMEVLTLNIVHVQHYLLAEIWQV